MSIVVVSTPAVYSPVYNGLYFVATSDNIAEPSFSFLFDIYIDGGLYTRHRIAPRPTDGYGVFNAGNIIETLVTQDALTDLDTDFITNELAYQKFLIKIGEEYEVSGVLVPDPDLATTSSVYAFNGALDFIELVSFDHTDYLLSDSAKLFLTNSGQVDVMLGERNWLYSMNATPANYTRRVIKTYSAAGALLNTFTSTNTFDDNAEDDEKFIRTSVGPFHVIQQHGATALDNVSYYTVQATTTGGTAISELKRFNIVDGCNRYEHIRVHFLNKLGAFDSFTFVKVSRRSSEINRKTYMRSRNETIATIDRFKTVSNTTIKDKISVNSDWITEDQSLWLEELVTSPVIFQEIDNMLIPILCTNNQVSRRKTEVDKLFNLALDFEYTYENNRQRY